jgi:CPA1 family monovalent cation:H+ antiporter
LQISHELRAICNLQLTICNQRGVFVGELIFTETLIIELLLVISLVALVVRRLRVPYTVALVVVGLLITIEQPPQFELTPDLILALFVPPLIFEAAFHLEFRRLRDNLIPIAVLAIPGVILTTVIVGYIVSYGLGLALTSALVFGALIAATDPVAVIALFRALGAPKRLAVMVEGESLFNDGTAIVVFSIMVAAASGASNGAFNLGGAVVSFLEVSIGGLAIGAALGWLASLVISRVDDYLIETTITTVLAFGSYLLAETFHVSGVLGVVAAGIVCGNIGPRGMSPTTRIVLFNFWEYLAFVANSLVFLLIGLSVNISHMYDNLVPIAIGIGAVLASRLLVVYGLSGLLNLFRRDSVPRTYQHVMFWGGLRGAISLALVLSLPASVADRDLLRVMAFGVVLFTLLVQGTTMNLLLHRLGLVERHEVELEYERRHGRLLALHAARDRLERQHRTGMISTFTWEKLAHELNERIEQARQAQQDLLRDQPTLREEEVDDARREGLRAQRAMLASLYSHGVISEPIYEELVTEVDAGLEKVTAEMAGLEVQQTAPEAEAEAQP